MRWQDNFYDFRFKWTAIASIGIHPTKTWLSQLVNFKNPIWHFEQRYAIKFCFKLGKNATETFGMLQTAFGASCIIQASLFQWHKRFMEGREFVRDDERCARSKEVNTSELIGILQQYKTCFKPMPQLQARITFLRKNIFGVRAELREPSSTNLNFIMF